jgi:hypothetical protein
MNIYILNAMEEEEDIDLIDPLSKEWDVIDVDDLLFPHKPEWTKNSVSFLVTRLNKTKCNQKEAKATAQARKEAAAAAKETATRKRTRGKGKDDGVGGSKDVESRPGTGRETSKAKTKVKPRPKVGVIRRSRSVEEQIDAGGGWDQQRGEEVDVRQSDAVEPRVSYERGTHRQSTDVEPRVDTPSSTRSHDKTPEDKHSDNGSNVTSPPLSPKSSTERIPGKGKAKASDADDGDVLSDPTQPTTPPPKRKPSCILP